MLCKHTQNSGSVICPDYHVVTILNELEFNCFQVFLQREKNTVTVISLKPRIPSYLPPLCHNQTVCVGLLITNLTLLVNNCINLRFFFATYCPMFRLKSDLSIYSMHKIKVFICTNMQSLGIFHLKTDFLLNYK